jgi:hypothetical protein
MSNRDMASIRLYTLTVVFVLVEWNNAVFLFQQDTILEPLNA